MKRTTRRTRLLLAGAALALALPVVLPQAALADNIVPPSVPAAIQVPPGNVPVLVGHVLPGHGTQTYTCTSGGTWGATAAPNAILTDDTGTPIIHHTVGPMWTSLADGSSVTGKKIASAPSPNAGTNIPMLLLQAVSTSAGPDGSDQLVGTTYIQRVNTTGGVVPTGSCTPGATQSVPYTADYYFYQSEDGQGDQG